MRKRNIKMQFYFNEKEIEVMDKRIKKLGLKCYSDLIRKATTEYVPRPTIDNFYKMITQITSYINPLNKIVHNFEQFHYIAHDDLDYIIYAISEINNMVAIIKKEFLEKDGFEDE